MEAFVLLVAGSVVVAVQAHVILDTLRSEGIRAELAVARSRPSVVATVGMPTDFDVFVHPRDTFRAHALLARDA